ncbi:hypothetical protein DM01DRAFT_1340380 [Hesseltinella vesiculosa]|uniref:Uncharacterized protein n=1 Tax=Hesseltinella vesiculosa TaxID=101127 RepID=A0A1X2G433_9FUNG|nr:hypothetical protein DM01DRAFT_1340380 [Hesseltinella vesiculosa]
MEVDQDKPWTTVGLSYQQVLKKNMKTAEGAVPRPLTKRTNNGSKQRMELKTIYEDDNYRKINLTTTAEMLMMNALTPGAVVFELNTNDVNLKPISRPHIACATTEPLPVTQYLLVTVRGLCYDSPFFPI